jgi:hypothetical protein
MNFGLLESKLSKTTARRPREEEPRVEFGCECGSLRSRRTDDDDVTNDDRRYFVRPEYASVLLALFFRGVYARLDLQWRK